MRHLRPTLTCALALLASALLAAPATAQEPVEVRVVSIRAGGLLEEGDEPEVDRELAPWAEKLELLGLARYAFLGRSAARAVPGRPLDLGLPLEHRAEVVVEEAEGERLRVRMTITRPEPDDPEARERVLTSEVLVTPGQPYVVRCIDAFDGEDDLLVLVVAGRRSDAGE